MWCCNCKQDVPGVSRQDALVCVRCDGLLIPDPPDCQRPPTWGQETSADERAATSYPESAGAAVKSDATVGPTLGGVAERSVCIHPSISIPAAPHLASRLSHPDTAGARRQGRLAAWALGLGFGLVSCGASLMTMGLIQGTPALGHLGLPIALTGQIPLFAGLMVKLDTLRTAQRGGATVPTGADETTSQAHSPNVTVSMDGWLESLGYHRHAAEDVSAQLLVRDLQHRLDRLAYRLSRYRGKKDEGGRMKDEG